MGSGTAAFRGCVSVFGPRPATLTPPSGSLSPCGGQRAVSIARLANHQLRDPKREVASLLMTPAEAPAWTLGVLLGQEQGRGLATSVKNEAIPMAFLYPHFTDSGSWDGSASVTA